MYFDFTHFLKVENWIMFWFHEKIFVSFQGWAVEELFHYFVQYKMKWQDRGFDTPLLNKTLFRKIRYFLGGKVRLMLSGGAPLVSNKNLWPFDVKMNIASTGTRNIPTLSFFKSPDTHSLTRTCLCVPLMQGYGLTETTACATVMRYIFF